MIEVFYFWGFCFLFVRAPHCGVQVKCKFDWVVIRFDYGSVASYVIVSPLALKFLVNVCAFSFMCGRFSLNLSIRLMMCLEFLLMKFLL